MNNKMFICALLLTIFIGCKNINNDSSYIQQSKSNVDTLFVQKKDSTSALVLKQISEQKLKAVLPDSTINKILTLRNEESLQTFYKEYKTINTINKIRESPVVIFSNKDNSQYLLAYQYEGDTRNNFSCFEIGYFEGESQLTKTSYYSTSNNTFFTESKLSLGLSLEEIIKIKGDSYIIKSEGNVQIVTYRIDDYENSPFLLLYNMPGYFIEVRLRDNKATRITFGFDYP